MVSPFGKIGEICRYYGWTLDDVLWNTPWAWIQRMMIDTPHYVQDGKKGTMNGDIEPEDASAFADYINGLIMNGKDRE